MFCIGEDTTLSAFLCKMVDGSNAVTQTFLMQQQWPLLLAYENFACFFLYRKISCSKLVRELHLIRHLENTLCTFIKVIMCKMKPSNGVQPQIVGLASTDNWVQPSIWGILISWFDPKCSLPMKLLLIQHNTQGQHYHKLSTYIS
jgi:hypothetical protein